MTDLRQAAQQALEALDQLTDDVDGTGLNTKPSFGAALLAITAMNDALKQPSCVGKDQRCPCQDGDACHYEDCGGTKARPVQAEPVSHAVIVGALFDFMGLLTTRKERLILSSTDNASPAADAIKVFAEMRGLSLDDALVQDWQNYTTPQKRQWVGLTDEAI